MPVTEANPGVMRTLIVNTTLNDAQARNGVNQLRGQSQKNSQASGIPKQVTNVGASTSAAATGTTSTVRVTFHRDPSDKNYGAAAVWVKGYQGNNNPVQVAQSYESPATFVLNNTGEPLGIIVQSTGNGGQAPLSSSPTTGLRLPKSSVSGYSTSTTTAYTPSSPPPATGVSFSTSGQGWFAGAGMRYEGLLQNANTNAAITNTTANKVIVYQFSLDSPWTLSSCSYKLSSTSASTHFNFGIYNASGSKVIDAAFDGSLSTLQTVTFGPTTLSAGTYYFAASATSTTPTGPVMFSSGGSTVQELVALSAVQPLLASAANSTSGNVMPATLGTLTAITSAAFWTGMPIPVWAV